MFPIYSEELKIYFQNRKWNNPNRKWNYFSNFQASDRKTSFSTSFSYDPKGSKSIFETRIGIIQTGNGFISPTSWPLIKNFFYWMFLIWSMGFKINFQNRKGNYPNRKWYYFSNFLACEKTSTKIVHSCVRPYKTIYNLIRPLETLQGNTFE